MCHSQFSPSVHNCNNCKQQLCFSIIFWCHALSALIVSHRTQYASPLFVSCLRAYMDLFAVAVFPEGELNFEISQ